MSSKPLTAIIVGAGHRSLFCAAYALKEPDRLKIVGVADPNPVRREKAAQMFNISEDMCFETADQLATHPKLADCIINGTMDHQHLETSLPLLERGYDMLLEKPFTINEQEMWQIVDTVKKHHNKVMICHVLRYAPFYADIRQKIIDGEIGDIINIQATEHVSYHHMAIGYIRGKWANSKKCHSGMLLAKCSHDMDIIMWMKSGIPPVSVSSFGSNFYFNPGKCPENAGTRCLVDCPIEDTCNYSAKKHYIDHPDRWSFYVWDSLEHIDNPTLEQKIESLKTDNPYGRCVWKCDNDVVDHQSVAINFADGCTATLNMVGGCAKPERTIHIIGTKGEIFGNMSEEQFKIYRIDPRPGCEYSEEVISTKREGTTDGHGGGDMRLVHDFVDYIQGKTPSISCTTLEDSISGHFAVFRAEQSRETGITEFLNV